MITNEGTGFDNSYVAGIFEYQHILHEIEMWFNQDPTSTLTFRNNFSEIMSRESRVSVEGWICLCYSYSKNQIHLKVYNFKDWLSSGDFSENEAIVTFDDIVLFHLKDFDGLIDKFKSGISTEEVFEFIREHYEGVPKQMTLEELDFEVLITNNTVSLEQMKRGNLSDTNRNFWESRVAEYLSKFILRPNMYDLLSLISGSPMFGLKLNDYFTSMEKSLAETLAQSEHQINYEMLFRVMKIFQLKDELLKYYFKELTQQPKKIMPIKFLNDEFVDVLQRLYNVTSETEKPLVYTNFINQLHHEDIIKVIVLKNTNNDERYKLSRYIDVDKCRKW